MRSQFPREVSSSDFAFREIVSRTCVGVCCERLLAKTQRTQSRGTSARSVRVFFLFFGKNVSRTWVGVFCEKVSRKDAKHAKKKRIIARRGAEDAERCAVSSSDFAFREIVSRTCDGFFVKRFSQRRGERREKVARKAAKHAKEKSGMSR